MSSLLPKVKGLWRKVGSSLKDALEDADENGWTWSNKKLNILNKELGNWIEALDQESKLME